MKTVQVTNERGIAFNVRRVDAGENYGRDLCLTNENAEPLIEFYDARYPHTEFGQFVSRYHASSLRSHVGGLTLDGGIADWQVSADNMRAVRAALLDEIKPGDYVRSLDFPGPIGRREDCYLEGVVEGFEVRDSCERYRIRVERRVVEGREATFSFASRIYPPVNGTPRLFGGVCDGVSKVERSPL